MQATQQFAFIATFIGVLSLAGLFASAVQAAMSLAWFWGDADGFDRWWLLGLLLVSFALLAGLFAAICWWRRWLPRALHWLTKSAKKRLLP